jgi:hypothetical protein
MSSFIRREIDLKFTLDGTSGTFNSSGANTVTLTGLRVSASIVFQQGPAFGELDMRVFGAPLDVMNKLTILQNAFNKGVNNTVDVIAGDADNGKALVFSGTMYECWADVSGAPDVALVVTAKAGSLASYTPVAPLSYKGGIDAATIASSIAQSWSPSPLVLENSGVNVHLRNQYLPGDANSQIAALSRMAHFDYHIDEAVGVLAIWPKGLARGSQGVTISADTDLVGYPAYTQKGIMVTTLYNPNIRVGQPVNVKSNVLTPVNGQWNPTTIGHDLESETPEGKWFTHVECDVFGSAINGGQ